MEVAGHLKSHNEDMIQLQTLRLLHQSRLQLRQVVDRSPDAGLLLDQRATQLVQRVGAEGLVQGRLGGRRLPQAAPLPRHRRDADEQRLGGALGRPALGLQPRQVAAQEAGLALGQRLAHAQLSVQATQQRAALVQQVLQPQRSVQLRLQCPGAALGRPQRLLRPAQGAALGAGLGLQRFQVLQRRFIEALRI